MIPPMKWMFSCRNRKPDFMMKQRKKILPIINREAALKRLDGDTELFQKFCQMFLEEIPEIIVKLETALQQDDFQELYKCAHYLKGSAAIIGAEKAATSAVQLEKSAYEKNDAREAQHLLQQVKKELTQLEQSISQRPVKSI